MRAGVCAEDTIDCSEDSEPLALIRPASLTPSTLACTVAARASLLWMMLLPRACSSGGSVHTAATGCAGCCLDLSAGQTTIAGGCPSCHTTSWACLERFAIRSSVTAVTAPQTTVLDLTRPRYEVEAPSSAPNTRHNLGATSTPT